MTTFHTLRGKAFWKHWWTRGPRCPWIAHQIFWDCSSHFFFFFLVAFRKEFTRISLCLYSAKSLHSLLPCLLTDQNFKNNSEKGHSRNISMRLFQNLANSFREDFLWFCLCSYSQVAPIYQSLVHGHIKISLTFPRRGITWHNDNNNDPHLKKSPNFR